jgi:hypothetical protein
VGDPIAAIGPNDFQSFASTELACLPIYTLLQRYEKYFKYPNLLTLFALKKAVENFFKSSATALGIYSEVSDFIFIHYYITLL